MKKLIFGLGVTAFAVGAIVPSFAPKVYADAQPGDVIVTLGQDLTLNQKDTVLNNMGVNGSNVQTVYVNNADEHKYLDKYIPAAQIGTKSISSAKITLGNPNTGLVVQTNNITFITNDMYLNALSTAGVKDANVYVTAPFPVSGTGALTGIIKAYEVSTGTSIPESQKQTANEEMVTTAKLASDPNIGQQKAADFIKNVKTEISKENPQSKDDIRALIQRVANQMGITLTDNQLNQLVDLFYKIKDLHIDWNKVNQTFQSAKEKWNNFANSSQGKNIIDTFIAFMKSILHAIESFFSKN